MKVSLKRKIHIMAFPQGTFLNARWSDAQSFTTPSWPSVNVFSAPLIVCSAIDTEP